jgi:hypothetical protein
MRSSPGFSGVGDDRSLVFCVVFCRSLFVLFLLAIVRKVTFKVNRCISITMRNITHITLIYSKGSEMTVPKTDLITLTQSD